ncbi:hypothetical protein A9G28_11625 [Gilliamella sp. Fer1-1]|uniref:J domain-containing protein n=1 Tax=Gilliamella sp. Fer1-1 TaxID=3120240 RepID=UPI00080ED8E6|nr:J domain-containing protein [Gilliamella apicola]OCG45949.1 hypothetical protein A9G28_11625 [Gilliamella apicola]
MNTNFWQLLGIEKTTDTTVIRQAYRVKLPLYHPETDPDGFKALRKAYELAMNYAKSPETAIDETTQNSEKSTPQLTKEQIKANEIYDAYQALLEDPLRCYNIDEWQKFIGSFYDYPMEVIDSVKWRLLELSYETTNISESCVKVLADNLRWRQQLMTQYTDELEKYDNYLNHIDRGDLFDYTCLPATNKTLQNATIDYIYNAKWLFWESSSEDVYEFLCQDTVIYLPNDKKFMLEFAHWHSAASLKNQSILDYALKCIAEGDQDENIIIEWKYIAAIQYTLLEDKQNALRAWLELYYSGHYQQKAESWIAGWCAYFEKNHFPLLVMALNNSYCVAADKTENYLYTIPQITVTTTSRLASLENIDEYPKEIIDFVNWALDISWNYKQVIPILLLDDGNNRLYRLYRHAIMLRHGNEILLQEILDDQSDDPFEQFILQHLQRQARQHLAWLAELSPVQEFKTWLFDNNENAQLPPQFDPDENGKLAVYARLWLDRFSDIPDIAKSHLYQSFSYPNMEMFDWVTFLKFNNYYQLPKSPDPSVIANKKEAYWQWYRCYLLVIAISYEPIETAKYLRQENNTFIIDENNPFKPLIAIFKHGNWQNETELYNLINNDSGLINNVLINYPNSIEWFIDAPHLIDFDDIEQKLEQIWTQKLANRNPIYLMLLYIIILNKTEQKNKLDTILQDITGDNKELINIAKDLQNNWITLSSDIKKKYSYTKQVDEIRTLAKRLSNYYGICDEDELEMLDKFKNSCGNDLVLRLCASLLIAKHRENQQKLESQPLPKNRWWQFWRWKGRTNIKGFIIQLCCSFIVLGLMTVLNNNFELDSPTFSMICYFVVVTNTVFAMKRRFNDINKGEPLCDFVGEILAYLLFFAPFWVSGIKHTNHFGPPVEKAIKKK